ncbi:MAG: glycosyltransferase family 39 protein, partial [Acidobacteriota bacterium]|nr:glycosyltransferase family 39 protein [Acidobacteriota bacterium]
VFPIAAGLIYLAVTRQLFDTRTWKRLRPFAGTIIILAIAAPWHVLATLRNPPYFDFTMRSVPGEYHGFLWFFFVNEQLLRFLNLRYPRDYNTVPRPLFWLLHFAWFFPFSAFLLRAFRLKYRGEDRASRMRLLALCWAGTVLGFFTLSTTQEYYSMPAYPAFALLMASAMITAPEGWWRWSFRVAGAIFFAALLAIAGILWASWSYPTPGDIAQALAEHPEAYTLSLGHMGDLTLRSFAYLRLPLVVAGVATLIGAIGGFFLNRTRAVLALCATMVLFYQAARLALIAFDPYLGSYPLAMALKNAPPGGFIVDDPYYEMSGIFFYTNRTGLILNGRKNNLEYGSYAPGAPHVFIGDADFIARWKSPDRWYIASEDEKVRRLRDLVGAENLHPLVNSGGKTLYVNR